MEYYSDETMLSEVIDGFAGVLGGAVDALAESHNRQLQKWGRHKSSQPPVAPVNNRLNNI
jgi:hypothetical protein